MTTDTKPFVLDPGDRLLKITEVAERLQVSRATAYQLVKDGSLPGIQLKLCGQGHKLVRVPESALQSFCVRNMTGKKSPRAGGKGEEDATY